MKRFIFTILCVLSAAAAFAQNYAIGHNEKHYIDAARSNRDVWTEVYFPAMANDTSMVAAGQFPTIVFGHGFAMPWSSYDYIWKYFVARGYVCVFPRTEGSVFGPSHPNFGGDLRFLSNLFGNVLNTTAGSRFAGHLTTKTAIAGHSMGGGSSYLGCANNTQVATMVTFAAAQTNPRSSAAALSCRMPCLVIGGEKDCVAAPATNAKLIYDSLTVAPYKQYVSITNGTHCNFASQGSVCEAGQIGTCGSLARTTQNNMVTSLLEPWFDYHLKRNCAAWQRFTDTVTTLKTATKITETHSSSPIFPTVAIAQSNNILTATATNTTALAWSNNQTTASISPTQSGNYTVTVTAATGCTATASINFTYVSTTESDFFRTIQLFPNPSRDNATLSLQLMQVSPVDVQLQDATGKQVWQTTTTTAADTHTISLPTAELPTGVYFITAKTLYGTWTGRYVRL